MCCVRELAKRKFRAKYTKAAAGTSAALQS
jgi:hypothetical protein